MAFAVKYWFSYTSEFGHVTRVDILQDGASATEVKAGPEPLILSRSGEGGNKYQPIRSTQATITIQAATDFQFDEFIGVGDKEYRVDVKFDSVLVWQGYLIPDLMTDEYKVPPYFVTLKAADGLHVLKGIDFTLTDPRRQSVMKTLWDCLDQTGLTDLGLYESIDVYEENMSQGDDDSPLTQAFIDTNQLTESGTVFNCYRVLEELIKPFGAMLYQDLGNWHLYIPNQFTGSFTRRKWDDWNDFDSSESFDPTLTTGANDKIVGNRSSRATEPAYTKQIINFTAGQISNLIQDGEFEAGAFATDTTLNNWTITGGASFQIQKTPRYSELSDFAVGITTSTAGSAENQSHYMQSAGVKVTTGGGGNTNKMSFRFQYNMDASGGDTDKRPLINYDVHIVPDDGTTNKRLKADGTWQDGATFIPIEIEAINNTGWVDVIVSDPSNQFFDIPKDGTLYVTFFNPLQNTWTINSFLIDRVIGSLSQEDTLPVEKQIFEGTIAGNFAVQGDDINVLFGDATQFTANDFGLGQFSYVEIHLNGGTLTNGDKIVLDISGTSRTYEKAAVPDPPTRKWTDQNVLAAQIRTDAGTDYIVTNVSNVVYITATSHDGNLDFGTITYPTNAGPTFDEASTNASQKDNIDPPASTVLTGLNQGAFTFPDGTVTQNWNRDGVSETDPILEILLQRIFNNYQTPTKKISGTLDQRAGTVQFSTILVDVNDAGSTPYIGNGIEWSDKSSIWTGEWIEIKDDEATVTIGTDQEIKKNENVTSTVVQNIASSPVVFPDYDRTVFVAKNGNDTTGAAGSIELPFKTIQAGVDEAGSAYTPAAFDRVMVYVFPGNYPEDVDIGGADYISLYLCPGVTVATTSGTACIHDDAGAVTGFEIAGNGLLRHTGVGTAGIEITAGSTLDVVAQAISGSTGIGINITHASADVNVKLYDFVSSSSASAGNVVVSNGVLLIDTPVLNSTGFDNIRATGGTLTVLNANITTTGSTSRAINTQSGSPNVTLKSCKIQATYNSNETIRINSATSTYRFENCRIQANGTNQDGIQFNTVGGTIILKNVDIVATGSGNSMTAGSNQNVKVYGQSVGNLSNNNITIQVGTFTVDANVV